MLQRGEEGLKLSKHTLANSLQRLDASNCANESVLQFNRRHENGEFADLSLKEIGLARGIRSAEHPSLERGRPQVMLEELRADGRAFRSHECRTPNKRKAFVGFY